MRPRSDRHRGCGAEVRAKDTAQLHGPALVFLIVVMLSLVFMSFAGVGTA